MADKPLKGRPLIAFTVESRTETRGGLKTVQHYALALKLVGRQVVDERVLDTDDSLHVLDPVVERAFYDYIHFSVDPFSEVER